MDKNIEKFKKAKELKAYASGSLSKIKEKCNNYVEKRLSTELGAEAVTQIAVGAIMFSLSAMRNNLAGMQVGAVLTGYGLLNFHKGQEIKENINKLKFSVNKTKQKISQKIKKELNLNKVR